MRRRARIKKSLAGSLFIALSSHALGGFCWKWNPVTLHGFFHIVVCHDGIFEFFQEGIIDNGTFDLLRPNGRC